MSSPQHEVWRRDPLYIALRSFDSSSVAVCSVAFPIFMNGIIIVVVLVHRRVICLYLPTTIQGELGCYRVPYTSHAAKSRN